MDELLSLYKQWRGCTPRKVETLARAGSNRQYVRLYDERGGSVVGVINDSATENRCFVYLASQFVARGLPMPKIFAFNDAETCYLQQDLGRTALYDALAGARKNHFQYGEKEQALLANTLRLLAHVQVEGAKGLDFSQCLSPTRFTRRAAMFDLNYFKYSFLRTTDLPFDEEKLEDDLQQLAATLAGEESEEHFFLYRDFQARNVMLDEKGAPWFIDFQGGMQGPLQYDVASFLWQASARYGDALRWRLVDVYLDELQTFLPQTDRKTFCERLRLFVFFRTLQVLGAYGLRGYVERKKYFLDSIPLAISNLREALASGIVSSFPYLEKTLQRMVALPKFNAVTHSENGRTTSVPCETKKLIVRIFSFSYKKGIPEDTSGNGGGYVFDCRSTHNPGRYERYKRLTGLNEPVIKFLEEDGEILTFLDSVYKLADAHVARYLERGFTDLMFSFGCTGGQHRSVYSAQHLAEHLSQKYGIEIRLQHREQGINQIFPAR